MALTNFQDNVNVIYSSWLNGIDILWQTVFAGTSTVAGARSAISAAKSGDNTDITKLNGLTTTITSIADANTTVTIAQLLTGIIKQTASLPRTNKIDTAANIVAGLPGCVVGTTFKFFWINDGSSIASWATNTGVTINTLSTLNQPNYAIAEYLVRITNVGGGTEAVTLYLLNQTTFN
jgi:hypothetical protein